MQISLKKEAWRRVYRERTCPPHGVLMDPNQADMVAAHVRGCSLCAAEAEDQADRYAWAELGRRMSADWPKPERPVPEPGQLWLLVPEKGGWDERARYMNPPLVLVLEVFDDVKGVRVVQVFDEELLAGDGDVDLGSGLGLAETWNSYALDQQDLDLCLGSVDVPILEQIKQRQDQELAEVDEESTVWFFRQLELEVGSRMALEAMGRLMERHDRVCVREMFANAEEIRGRVLAFDGRIILPGEEDGLRMLASATLPDELTVMAAASEEGQMPLTITKAGDAEISCRQVLVDIMYARLDGSTIRVSGQLPEDARSGLLFAWWRSDKGMEDGAARFDPSEGTFRVDFSGRNEVDFEIGEPVFLLVQSDDEEYHEE